MFAPRKALQIEAAGERIIYPMSWKNLLAALFPLMLAAATLWGKLVVRGYPPDRGRAQRGEVAAEGQGA